MCEHNAIATVEEAVLVQRWEGDEWVQEEWEWNVCEECGDDFSCRVP